MSYVSPASLLRYRRADLAQGLTRVRGDALLAAAGPLGGLDVLVLGTVVASTMCALAMSECRRAESRLPGCRVDAGLADVVLIPGVTSLALPGLVRQASAGLRRGGLLAMRPGQSAREVEEVRCCLSAAGFGGVREVVVDGERLVLARL